MKDENARRRGYWLDDPANVRRLIWGLVAICILVVAADLFYGKHAHYAVENWLGFDAAFGFASYVFLVFAAIGLRKLLRRDEDYYD
jgi:hypothetical protein